MKPVVIDPHGLSSSSSAARKKKGTPSSVRKPSSTRKKRNTKEAPTPSAVKVVRVPMNSASDDDDDDEYDEQMPSLAPAVDSADEADDVTTRKKHRAQDDYYAPTILPVSEDEKKEAERTKRIESGLATMLYEAMSPFFAFVGMLSMKLAMPDERRMYRFRPYDPNDPQSYKRPFHAGNRTIDKLIEVNPHLSQPIVDLISDAYLDDEPLPGPTRLTSLRKEKEMRDNAPHQHVYRDDDATDMGAALIGASVPTFWDLMSGRERRTLTFQRLVVVDPNSPISPEDATLIEREWLFGMVSMEMCKFLLNDVPWGAIVSAMSVLKRKPACKDFTFHQLIGSLTVADKFAELVQSQMAEMVGGNAYVMRPDVQNGMLRGTSFAVSAGIATRNRTDERFKFLMMWFDDVRATDNKMYETVKQSLRTSTEQFNSRAPRMGHGFVAALRGMTDREIKDALFRPGGMLLTDDERVLYTIERLIRFKESLLKAMLPKLLLYVEPKKMRSIAPRPYIRQYY